jgi:ADP-ribose pyrophosphatase YjhB (NUDIX family)
MPSLGVFAIILDDERRVCCVRLTYAHRGWATPGGQVESGESPIAALRREVLEETGYTVDIGRLIGVYSKPEQDDIILSFEATVMDEMSNHSSSEIAEVRFFAQNELPSEMTEVTRHRIQDGLSGLTGFFREFYGENADEQRSCWPGE